MAAKKKRTARKAAATMKKSAAKPRGAIGLSKEVYKDVAAIAAGDSAAWRAWLEKNHAREQSVWLIIYKKNSGRASIDYSQAVDDALCFGWVDSLPNKRDGESYYQYFSRRNPKSNWSKVNKDKVKRLKAAGLMASAGLEMVRVAKKDGTWDALNDVDNLVEPPDLADALRANDTAAKFWAAFPKSTRRGILEWIFTAKTPATRAKRVHETVRLAAENIRANQYRKK